MEEEEEEKPTKKEFLFSFAKINKYYLFPFLAPIFCCLANFFIHSIYEENKNMDTHFFLTIHIDCTYLIGGLLYFISKIRTKTEETRNNAIVYRERASSFGVKYIYNDGSKKSKIKIILFLILISSLITFTTVSNLYSMGKTVFERRLYFLFFIALFSKFILKNDIFKHQILSMSIAFVGLIILFIPTSLKINENDILINIISFFSSITYTLFLVMIKHLTHNYYFSPLLCILFIGLISIMLSFIGFTIYSLIKYQDFSFIIDSLDFSKNEMGYKFYIYALVGLIFGACLQLFTVYVVYYFSPILLTVTDSISPMLSWVIKLIQKGPDKNPYLEISIKSIGYLIQLIAGLIYNEIIICNFCGFNEYTKKYLQEKGNQELIALRKTENSIKNGEIKDLNENKENDSSYISESEDNKSDKS